MSLPTFVSYDQVFSVPLFIFLDFTLNIHHFFRFSLYVLRNRLGFSSVNLVAISDQFVQFAVI